MSTLTGSRSARLTQPVVTGLLVLYVGWGSTFPAMRVALRTLPPLLLLSARCLLAGLLLLALARARRARLPGIREWSGAFVVGGLTLGLGHGLTTWGVVTVTAGVAAILVAMVAIWIAVLAWLVLGERPGRHTVVGLVVGFAGLALVTGWATTGTYPLLAIAALVCAPICWALGSVLSKRVILPADTLMSTAAQLLITAPLAAAAGLVAGEWRALEPATAFTGQSVLAFAYLTLCGYVLVFTVYTWLLRQAPMSVVGTYAYVNPLVAAALGVLLLGEGLSAATVLGGAVILVGVALVVLDGALGGPTEVGASGSRADISTRVEIRHSLLSASAPQEPGEASNLQT